jgi:signal transduction histidine kinase
MRDKAIELQDHDATLSHTVLLLDDEPNVLAGLRRALRKEPYELLLASSAPAAIALLHSRSVDVVISDQDMPGMTGTAFLAKVRELFPDTIRFMLTGKATLDIAIQAINDDAVSQFLVKPCDPVSLTNSIRQALRQKELEDALERARRQEVELKDRFLSHVSHELRSPLTAIYQFVTILLDGLAGDITEQQREYLDIVSRNVLHLQRIVSDLLDCTRSATGKIIIEPQELALPPIVQTVLDTLRPTAAGRDIDLVATLPADLPHVYADPLRVRQVLTNLIENGIKFTPGPGTVSIGTRALQDDPDAVCMTVTDTGCGIQPDDLTRIFNRLVQTTDTVDLDRQGLGLGLYICRELITQQGGQIWVESEAGHGSTFCFTLPRLATQRTAAPTGRASTS